MKSCDRTTSTSNPIGLTAANAEVDTGASDKGRTLVRVTVFGGIIDLALGLIKLWFGWVGHSTALIVDGVHSLSDVLTDVMVISIGKLAFKQADEKHPYGHRRFETMGTMLLGATLILVAGMISWEGGEQLFRHFVLDQPKSIPSGLVVWVAFFSAVMKEAVYQYTVRVATQMESSLLLANAWHSRSDAVSSILVCLGVWIAASGYPWVDSVIALGIGVYIAFIGVKIALRSVDELVDTSGLSTKDTAKVNELVKCIPGIMGVHELRSRRMGSEILLDLHLEVAAHITVSEGHFIGQCAVDNIQLHFSNVREVIFHIDPTGAPHFIAPLPARGDISALLTTVRCDNISEDALRYWQNPSYIALHYLHAGIEMTLTYTISPSSGGSLKEDTKKRPIDAVFMAQFESEWQISQGVWKQAIYDQKWHWLVSVSFNVRIEN